MSSQEWNRGARHLKKNVAELRVIIEAVGLPKIQWRGDPFQSLVRSILSQQLSTGAARTIAARFVALAPPFPEPTNIARWPIQKFRKVGISGAKTLYLKSLAAHWKKNTWREGWDDLTEPELVARLCEVKGIGEWTAHMFLMFNLGRVNVLPIGDLGVRRGVQLLYGLDQVPSPKELVKYVQHWEGYYSVAAWYLWAAQDRKILVANKSSVAEKRKGRELLRG